MSELYRRLFPSLSRTTSEWSWPEWGMAPIALLMLIAPCSEFVHDILVSMDFVKP